MYILDDDKAVVWWYIIMNKNGALSMACHSVYLCLFGQYIFEAFKKNKTYLSIYRASEAIHGCEKCNQDTLKGLVWCSQPLETYNFINKDINNSCVVVSGDTTSTSFFLPGFITWAVVCRQKAVFVKGNLTPAS